MRISRLQYFKIYIHPKLAAIDAGTSLDKLVLATDGILVV